jgi:hypothetical protein
LPRWTLAEKITSREAVQDLNRKKREANTERRPNVLISNVRHRSLTAYPSLFALMEMSGQEEAEFEPPPRRKAAPRLIGLS